MGGGSRHHPDTYLFHLLVPKENRMASKPRQVRVQLTGGIEDVDKWSYDLDSLAANNNFRRNFQDGPTPFGDHGPLHKVVIGFIEDIRP